MPRTPTPLPERNTSSAPRSRSSETNISRARILARAAISRTALRVIPGSARSYVGGVWRDPPETRNTLRAVVSTTRPLSFRRTASKAPSASASRRATASAPRAIDLTWLIGPDMRRTEAATCNAGCDGISGRAREVIVANPRVVARSPAMTVIRARPSTTPLASTTFLAPWRRSSDAHGGSMRTTSRDERSRSKCASSRKGAPRWIRIVSKHPSPYRNPRLWMETRAAASGIRAPSSHAEAVRGHLHAVLREGLRMSAELVERLLILRLRVRVGDDAATHREVRRFADHSRGTDCDVPVDRTIPGDVADRTRVHAAAVRFETLDDLHGPRLRSARNRAAGECGPHQVGYRPFLPEASSHDALQMMHVRERPQAFQEWHVDAAEFADFAEVIPLEVDDHHVLRGVFLACEELVCESMILGGGSTAGPGPFDRPRLDVAATDSEEPFRTRGQQAVVSGLEETSERRGRAFPEALVRGGGRPSQRKRDAMGEIDLEDLPLVYRPFRFFDGVDRKSTRLNSSHLVISYAVFCLKKKKNAITQRSVLIQRTPAKG